MNLFPVTRHCTVVALGLEQPVPADRESAVALPAGSSEKTLADSTPFWMMKSG